MVEFVEHRVEWIVCGGVGKRVPLDVLGGRVVVPNVFSIAEQGVKQGMLAGSCRVVTHPGRVGEASERGMFGGRCYTA